jgi:hypothetical protein
MEKLWDLNPPLGNKINRRNWIRLGANATILIETVILSVDSHATIYIVQG